MGAIVVKTKDIISTLFEAIGRSTENSEKLDSETFKVKLDQNLAWLRKANDVQELTEIEETIKKLIFRQHEAERIYRQNRYAEFSKIVETLMEGVNEIASENHQFNNQFDVSLSEFDRVAELDDLKQIRQRISQVVTVTKKVLQQKRHQDSEKRIELSKKIEALETQLQQATEETLIDGLTKVANRRGFDQRIREAAKRSQTLEHGFGLVLFDVDHFKT
ncbi:MAG: diguanylate cyclase, partial [Candidatus Poribacteria bacterium]|nr:diguanylate cyclase [Candidatus Poribacteria bacterium]